MCIGHRGAMGYAPENTLASFQLALDMGVHAVELDVHLVDGQLVVIHDDQLERTTSGSGSMQDHSFEELRRLDAGSGEHIPTLGEVVQLLDQRVGLNIELKGPGTAGPVVEQVRNMRAAGWRDDQILLSSFNHQLLRQARELDSTVKIGALISNASEAGFKMARSLQAISINAGLSFVDQDLVDEAHANNLRVYIFTVNESADIQRMRELGVDGVFCDYPDRVLADQAGSMLPSDWR
jgi:glycerophosphoryl diester phosphodiesterase